MDIIVHRDDIVKNGWLSRQSKCVKDWCGRWFALTPQYLCSFKAQGDLRNPTEVIRLRECFTVKSTESVTGKENSFRVDTPDRVFYLIADTSADKEAWIFLAVYTPVSFILPCYYLLSFAHYDTYHELM